MTTFFHIGQRVKIIRNVGPIKSLTPVIVGKESVIIGFIDSEEAQRHLGCNTQLLDFKGLLFHTDELEPILPDGLESPEEIKELYTPEEEYCYVS